MPLVAFEWMNGEIGEDGRVLFLDSEWIAPAIPPWASAFAGS
jgi:hypothetical protein